MNKKNFIKYLMFSLIFVLSFATISAHPAAAKAAVDEDKAQAYKMLQEYYNISEQEAEQLFEDVQEAQKFYIFEPNGTLIFDKEAALENNVNPSVVEEISETMEAIGEEKLNEVGRAAKNCPGISLLDTGNNRVFGDTCQTDELIISLIVVGTLIAIVGIVVAFWSPPAAAGYSIAALIIGAGSAILAVKNKGCGVIIYWAGPKTGIESQTTCIK